MTRLRPLPATAAKDVQRAIPDKARLRFWPLQDIVFVREFMGVRNASGISTLGRDFFAKSLHPAASRAELLLTRFALDSAFADRAFEPAFRGSEHCHADTPPLLTCYFFHRSIYSCEPGIFVHGMTL